MRRALLAAEHSLSSLFVQIEISRDNDSQTTVSVNSDKKCPIVEVRGPLRAIAENRLTSGERFGSTGALQFSSACGGGHDRGRPEEEASSRCAGFSHQQALKCVQVTGVLL